MASFNNPFLFIQVSVVVFTAIGFGLGLPREARPNTPPETVRPDPDPATS
jgi:hypothetical protein